MSWGYIFCWVEHHPGLASWVQAFGSIAAILAAIWIASRDSRAIRNEKNEGQKNAVIRAEAVVKEAGLRAGLAVEFLKDSLGLDDINMITAGLRQSLQHLMEILSSYGVDSDTYTELFMVRIALEDLILLVGVCTPEMVWDEEGFASAQERVEAIKSVHAALASKKLLKF